MRLNSDLLRVRRDIAYNYYPKSDVTIHGDVILIDDSRIMIVGDDLGEFDTLLHRCSIYQRYGWDVVLVLPIADFPPEDPNVAKIVEKCSTTGVDLLSSDPTIGFIVEPTQTLR